MVLGFSTSKKNGVFHLRLSFFSSSFLHFISCLSIAIFFALIFF